MRPASQIPFWRGRIPAPLHKSGLACTGSIQDELIASFDFYAEIKDLGKELLKANQHPHPTKSFARFQAYIRQAKTFYETAELQHHRASPLSYYYSFMNFAKALVFLKTPTFADRNLHHGITPNSKSGRLNLQRVTIKSTGVFPAFYESSTGRKLPPNCSFRIVDLLSYISDVSYEFEALGYGLGSSFKTHVRAGIDEAKVNAFTLLAVNNARAKNFKLIENQLTKHFDEVSIPESLLLSLFNLNAEHAALFRYFEGKVFPTKAPFTDHIAGIAQYIATYPFEEDFLCTLNCPIRTPALRPMNEMLAIYTVMFFLGSLVRYRPDLLEKMLSTRDAWILERFIKSAPLTFLRYARNLLDGKYLFYVTR